MKKILLILLGVSVALFADFSRSVDIVTDSETSLQWQDDVDAKDSTKTWQAAIDYCEASSLGGYSDWRLPNINELTSLVEDSKSNPAINSTFQNVASTYYWSSTTGADYANRAWGVSFDYGDQYNSRKGDNDHVRCVRAGQ